MGKVAPLPFVLLRPRPHGGHCWFLGSSPKSGSKMSHTLSDEVGPTFPGCLAKKEQLSNFLLVITNLRAVCLEYAEQNLITCQTTYLGCQVIGKIRRDDRRNMWQPLSSPYHVIRQMYEESYRHTATTSATRYALILNST